MVSASMHVKNLSNNLENEINNISKEDGLSDEFNKDHFDEEFAQIKKMIKKIHKITPRMEKLETRLGILDGVENEKDQELENIPISLIKIVKKNEEIVKKAQEDQWRDEMLEAKLKQDAEDAAYTPKQGFDWDTVSDSVNKVF